ncbi:MAG: peptidylprolyl isomerase [Clostridia bacterium]|nr:peptidylprolyl isomerase [Clostridia bacterium]
MKHTLAKLTGILLVLCLVLTGCNLITVDPVMQLDEDLKALKEDYATVLATYDGGEITKEDVMASFLYMYSYYGSMYSMFGYGMDEEIIESLKQNAVEVAVQNRAIAREFDNRGMTLSEEKKAELAEELEATFQEAKAYYLENAAGETEEARAKQAEYNMYRDGYIYEHVQRELEDAAKYDLLIEAVRNEITELSEEELLAGYEQRLIDDEEAYNYDYAAFESAMMDDVSVVAWMPEGYRTVKHILIIPEEEVMSAVTEARDAYDAAVEGLAELEEELADVKDDDAEDSDAEQRSEEEIKAEIDQANADMAGLKKAVEEAEEACLASVQDKIDEIYAAIEAGEDFDDLIAAYGEDPGMQNEPTMSRGYYVSADSESWDPSFTEGAMLLEKVGDVSEEPVIGMSGLHIIRYESEVPAGAVDFEEVRDALYHELLESARDDNAGKYLTEWTNAVNAKYDVSKFTVDMAMYGY